MGFNSGFKGLTS